MKPLKVAHARLECVHVLAQQAVQRIVLSHYCVDVLARQRSLQVHQPHGSVWASSAPRLVAVRGIGAGVFLVLAKSCHAFAAHAVPARFGYKGPNPAVNRTCAGSIVVHRSSLRRKPVTSTLGLMTPVLVRFQQIHHVHRNGASRSAPKHTVFSFVSDYSYTPYVTAPGFPRLEPGMRVQALLEREGDWKSLIGWRDLDTGAVASPDPYWHLYRVLFLAVWMLLAGVLATKAILVPSKGELVGAALIGMVVFALGFYEYRCWQRTKLHVQALNNMPLPNEA